MRFRYRTSLNEYVMHRRTRIGTSGGHYTCWRRGNVNGRHRSLLCLAAWMHRWSGSCGMEQGSVRARRKTGSPGCSSSSETAEWSKIQTSPPV